MSYSIESLTPARTSAVAAAFGFAKDMTRRMAVAVTAWNNRRSLGELAALDDRMLADLGLIRGDLGAAVSEPLWSDPTTRLSVLSVERRASERAHQNWRRSKAAELRASRRDVSRSFEACAD